MSTNWSEAAVAQTIMNEAKLGSKLLVVPNCKWTGHECDLLILERGMRIIDVEIKCTRQDLRADVKKDKWWLDRPWSRKPLKTPRHWPDKVWKHYYVCPASIWKDDLLEILPEASGVIVLLEDGRWSSGYRPRFERRAKPNPEAKPVSVHDALDLARLASIRYWATRRKLEGKRDVKRSD